MTWFPAPRTEPAGCGPPGVLMAAMDFKFVCIILYILSGRYKFRQIPEFKGSLAQREFGSRSGWNGNSRAGPRTQLSYCLCLPLAVFS